MGMFEYKCLMPSLRQFTHLAKIVIGVIGTENQEAWTGERSNGGGHGMVTN